MDANTFDDLVKRLTERPGDRLATPASAPGSRRALLRLVTALPLTGLLATLLSEAGEAGGRRKRRKKRNKRRSGNDKDNRTGKRTGRDTGKTPGTPAPGCTPTTCAAQGKNCGTIADGCGGQLRCGPDACGEGFHCIENVCRCPDGNARCQEVCCQAGEVCQNGDGPCCAPVDPCAPNSCGQIANTCGTLIDCGTCSAPNTCGGGNPGTANVCGCTNSTCPAGANCGSITNVCGGTISCGGSCPFAGQPCVDNVCGTCVATCEGKACGADNGCGSPCQTGSCPIDQTCLNGTCLQNGHQFTCSCSDGTTQIGCARVACGPNFEDPACGQLCAAHGGYNRTSAECKFAVCTP